MRLVMLQSAVPVAVVVPPVIEQVGQRVTLTLPLTLRRFHTVPMLLMPTSVGGGNGAFALRHEFILPQLPLG